MKNVSQTQAALAEARLALKSTKVLVAELSAKVKAEREAARIAKAEAVASKRAAAIAKAQARLQKLLDKANPVGAKALKANRKPGKVTVTKMA